MDSLLILTLQLVEKIVALNIRLNSLLPHIFKAIFFSISFISGLLYAQESASIHYTTKNGLLSNEIYDLFEDKDGHIWIGSDKGVNRFDSYQIQAYSLSEGLADKNILYIHQDSKGRIWFLSYNGKLSYWKDGNLFNEQNDSILKQIKSPSYFSSFLEDSSGNIWFGTRYNGIFRLDASNQWEHISERPTTMRSTVWPSKEIFPVLYLFQDTKNEVWISNSVGNFKIEGSDFSQPIKHQYPQRRGRFCYKPSHYLCSSTHNVITLSDIRTGEVLWKKKIHSAKDIYTVKCLSDSLFYIATDTGVYSFDEKGRLVASYLLGKRTSNFLIDREGNLWISTLKSGLFLIKNREISNFETEAKYSILEKGDSILFGGLDLKLHCFNKNQLRLLPIHFGTLKHPSIQDRISGLAMDAKNQIWLGSYQSLFQLDGVKANLINYLGVRDMVIKGKTIYIATIENYLLKLDLRRLKSNLPRYKPEIHVDLRDSLVALIEKYHLYAKSVNCISAEREDYLLLGTDEGVLSYQDSIQPLNHLPKGEIIALEQERSENLWILERKKGLYYYHNDKDQLDTIELFEEKKKVLYSSLSLEDDSSIWVGSDKGLIHVEYSGIDFKLNYINRHHGLQNEEINNLLIAKDTAWLATSSGISFFPVKSFQDTVAPILSIDSIVLADRTVKRFSDTQLISYDNKLQIHYTGISFKDEGELEYEYQLIGADTQSGLIKERTINLKELKPYDYRIVLTAIDSYGNRSKAQELNFTISLLWWQDLRLWVIILIGLISIGVYLFRKLLKKRIVEVKDKMLQPKNKYITVLSVLDGNNTRISLENLLYIEASRNYKELVQIDKRTLVRISMDDLMEKLKEAPEFIRVHRSFIINIKKIEGYKADRIIIQDIEIPIGRTYRMSLKEKHVALGDED